MIDPTVLIHPQALVEDGATIAKNTRIWAFAHILPGAVIGEDCNICDHTFIENQVVIGNRVTVKCGVQLWDGITLEDDVFIGPNATFTNDPFPRSKQYLIDYPKTLIKRGASIGANATLLPGLQVGNNAMVAAGSVVTRNVPPNALVSGNPARVKRFINTTSLPCLEIQPEEIPQQGKLLGVGEAMIFHLQKVTETRGLLTVAQFPQSLPFIPNRFFVIQNVPPHEVRGNHAHQRSIQYLICLKGYCWIGLDDGKKRIDFLLDQPHLGLLIPPKIWSYQYKFSSDALLLVCASDSYDSQDYIHDYDEFLSLVSKEP